MCAHCFSRAITELERRGGGGGCQYVSRNGLIVMRYEKRGIGRGRSSIAKPQRAAPLHHGPRVYTGCTDPVVV